MRTFEIKFKHTVEQTYTAIVEAETREMAEELFDIDPFGYVREDEAEDTQGLRLDILEVKSF